MNRPYALSAMSISSSTWEDECGRALPMTISNFCRKVHYVQQKYRTHPDRSVQSLPIPDGNPGHSLYPGKHSVNPVRTQS